MESKSPIQISGKLVGTILLCIVSAFFLGIGLCLVLVWDSTFLGIFAGLVGLVALLALIPMIKGSKK